jgi:hypothetical protein
MADETPARNRRRSRPSRGLSKPRAEGTAETGLEPGGNRLPVGIRRQFRPGAGQVRVRAIINSALVSYERLPMLEIVFDRLVRLMTTSLRNFTSDNVEVSLDSITSIRFGDYLNSIPCPRSWRCSTPKSSTITGFSRSIPT